MTTKEKIVLKSIASIESRLKEIDLLLTANPLGEICKIRIEAQKLLEDNKGELRHSVGFIEKIEALSIREKEQFELAEKSKNSSKLIEEKIKLESELHDLRGELFHINRKK